VTGFFTAAAGLGAGLGDAEEGLEGLTATLAADLSGSGLADDFLGDDFAGFMGLEEGGEAAGLTFLPTGFFLGAGAGFLVFLAMMVK
jgi:hypothetical protein